MQGKSDDFYVKVCGDGSYSTPETCWTALGGIGAVVLNWNEPGEYLESRSERQFKDATAGQTGSFTASSDTASLNVIKDTTN